MAELIERQAAVKAAEHAYNEWNLAMAAADGQRQINRVFKMQELCMAVISVFENVPAADLDCTGCVWLNTRHQKCSCCRRNQYIKDNYKEAGV